MQRGETLSVSVPLRGFLLLLPNGRAMAWKARLYGFSPPEGIFAFATRFSAAGYVTDARCLVSVPLRGFLLLLLWRQYHHWRPVALGVSVPLRGFLLLLHLLSMVHQLDNFNS